MQPAGARAWTVNADLAGIGDEDHRRAGVGSDLLQLRDLLIDDGIQLLCFFLLAEDIAELGDVAFDAVDKFLGIDRHVDGGRDLRNVRIFRPRTAADDDEIGFRRIDSLVVGFEQRADLQIFAVGIFLQVGRQVGADDACWLDAERIEIVERGNIENQNLLRRRLQHGLALRVLDRHFLSARSHRAKAEGRCRQQSNGEGEVDGHLYVPCNMVLNRRKCSRRVNLMFAISFIGKVCGNQKYVLERF
ncbi:hypothetical protein D3C87_1213540 [compost metagenome]